MCAKSVIQHYLYIFFFISGRKEFVFVRLRKSSIGFDLERGRDRRLGRSRVDLEKRRRGCPLLARRPESADHWNARRSRHHLGHLNSCKNEWISHSIFNKTFWRSSWTDKKVFFCINGCVSFNSLFLYYWTDLNKFLIVLTVFLSFYNSGFSPHGTNRQWGCEDDLQKWIDVRNTDRHTRRTSSSIRR
jgi:hypothetical protein